MKHLNILPGVLACALFMSTSALAQNATLPDQSRLDAARAALAEQQPGFVENRGQWHPDAKFMARVNGLDLWITNKGLVYDLYRMEHGASGEISGRTGHVVGMRFVGASNDAVAIAEQPQPGTFNYFLGKDPSRWATNVRRYNETRIRNLYPGVDARLYFDQGAPRYDLVVAPGADPRSIKIAYDGAEKVYVNKAGNLVFSTMLGEVAQQGLFAYQIDKGKMRPVPCNFNIKDGIASIMVAPGSYDRNLPLVIDPIIYSTYLGGSAWDEARAVAADTSSTAPRIYVTGFTFSNNFPTFPGSYQTSYAGNGSVFPGGDVFVARIDPLEAPAVQLNWGTYIGSDGDDAATDIAVDATGSVYLTGVAGSEFPVTNTIVNANARGVFAVKLNPAGTTLLYSAFVCDNASDLDPALALGSGGRLYITGGTTSDQFPVTENAFQGTKAAGSDAFVAVVAPNGDSLMYGSYLGGNFDDAGTGIVAGAFGDLFVTGRTTSTNFPLRRNLAYDTTQNGDIDLFVTKLDIEQSSGSQLVYSSLVGGSGADIPTHLLVDPLNQLVVVGSTTSSDFPVKNALQSTYGGNGDAFVLRMSLTVVPPNQISYSTYLGGSGSDVATDAVAGRNGDLHLVGWTGAAGFPLTVNAIDTSYGGDSSDAFVSKLNTQGELLYSTYFGGSGGDKGYGITLGRGGSFFVVGQTIAMDFPVSRTPYQGTLRSDNRPDAFVAHMVILELTSPAPGTTLCTGSPFTITWNGVAGRNYDLYISSDSGRTYNPLEFNITGTSYRWSIPANFPAGTAYRFKIVTSGEPEFDVSDSNIVINALPIITRHPANVTQVEGGSATFIAQATGTPAPTVQWQFNAGGVWTTITGQTGTTLRVENVTAAQKGTQYRAIFTNSCGSDTSDLAVLNVSALQVTSPVGGEELCAGTTHTITWLAQSTSGPFDILLSSNDGGEYTSIATGVTGNSYNWTIPSTLFGTRFRIQVRIANAAAIDVSDSSFTIHNLPSVLTHPASQTQPAGATATFQAQGGGFPLPVVRWQVNTGGEWTDVENATALTLQVENLQMTQNGARYRAIFTNPCGADTTDEAVLTVTPPASVGRENSTAFRLTVAPNPMVGSGEIRFTLPRAGRVELTITDLRGRVLARPVDAAMSAGDHIVRFDAASLASGTYMVDIASGREHQTVKLTITR